MAMAEAKTESPLSDNYMQSSKKDDDQPWGGDAQQEDHADQPIYRPGLNKRQRLVQDVRDELLGRILIIQHS
jgi:hypothetical protein